MDKASGFQYLFFRSLKPDKNASYNLGNPKKLQNVTHAVPTLINIKNTMDSAQV